MKDGFQICLLEGDVVKAYSYERMLLKLAPQLDLIRFDEARDALKFISEQIEQRQKMPHALLLDTYLPGLNLGDFLNRLEDLAGQTYDVPQIYLCTTDISSRLRRVSDNHRLIHSLIYKPFDQGHILKILENLSQREFVKRL
ncbi:MAG: hypothetical protein R8P61_35145 [Bacteroidia bacterium]|nr:hypothetical protein [Bacteroidia bacterium]